MRNAYIKSSTAMVHIRTHVNIFDNSLFSGGLFVKFQLLTVTIFLNIMNICIIYKVF